MLPALILSLALLLLAPGFPLASLVASLQAAEGVPGAGEAGELEVAAFAAAWPERIVETAYRDGDWMLRIDESWFAWANGRMIPEIERSSWQDYAPLAMYRYPLEMPPLPVVDEEGAERLRRHVRENAENPPRRHEAFSGTLLAARSRAETEQRVVRMEVAGYTLTVHERLREPLTRVSEELRALRLSDPEVDVFLKGLVEMNGYNYRYVEGTRSRSFHSYGLAVDLVPQSYGGRHAYWMWAASKVKDWWTVPYERRWMVPLPVVQAFEKEGFVWGGKWLFFDTMHFEYRPEVMVLSRAAGD